MGNYILLERIELNNSTTSVTFANIPQTGYTDLKVVVSGRSTSWGYSYNNLNMAINGAPSGTAYSDRVLYSVGGSAGSLGHSGADELLIGATPSTDGTANAFSNTEVYISNYASSNYKSISSDGVAPRNSGTNGDIFINLTGGTWASTSPITSLVFTTDVTGFRQYTTFSLYGIAATGTSPAIAPRASGGNVITTDSTYWYHAFLTSGTFTPLASLTADVLVVAGGGAGASVGGSAETGGGGGAGGFRALLSQSFSTISHTVTVGAGGSVGSSGSNSSVNSITASGGGYGGGGSGGSGGGGLSANNSQRFGGAGNAGSYSPVEGYAGGNGNSSNNSYAGGGGGAGAVGANGTGGQSGAGGIGSYSAISGGSTTALGVLSGGNYYFAGGGGGGSASGVSAGSGGTGGGGAGETAGTINTGGGAGGGSPSSGSSRSGGSGIVIIRYAV
jgi:hypothetical protein